MTIEAEDFDIEKLKYIYHQIKNHSTALQESEGNVEFLRQKRNFHTFEPCSIKELKMYLNESKIECRLT